MINLTKRHNRVSNMDRYQEFGTSRCSCGGCSCWKWWMKNRSKANTKGLTSLSR